MNDAKVLEQASEIFERGWDAYLRRRYDEAETLITQAKELWEQELGHESLPVSTCLNNLGRICEETDRLEEGIRWHRAAVALRRRLLGEHPETAFCLGNLGTAYAFGGQLENAEQALGEAVAMFEKCGDGGHDVEGYRKNLDICRKVLAGEL